MSIVRKQKNRSHQFDQPKYTARNRLQQTSTSTINHQDKQKSIRKSSSIKYLKEISPKRSKSNSKFISNNILKLLDRYQQNLNNSDSQNTHHSNHLPNFQLGPSNYSKLGQALKTIDFDQQRNCQTVRLSHDRKSVQKSVSIQESMLQKFQSNETKIILMRQNLEKIFTNYKQREKQICEMKSCLRGRENIKVQNDFLSKQISRVQQMIKQALLERQKLKHGPFSQLTKRNKK